MRDAHERGVRILPAFAKASAGRPPKRMSPASYGSMPAMHSNSVVFPDPFGPISPSTSPWRIDNDTSATAVRRPYDFVSPSIDTMGAAIGSGKCTGGEHLLPALVSR